MVDLADGFSMTVRTTRSISQQTDYPTQQSVALYPTQESTPCNLQYGLSRVAEDDSSYNTMGDEVKLFNFTPSNSNTDPTTPFYTHRSTIYHNRLLIFYCLL